MPASTEKPGLKPGRRSTGSSNSDWGHDATVRFRFGIYLLVALLLLVMVLAAALGVVEISPRTIFSLLLNRTGLTDIPQTWPLSDESIILHLRLPRVVGAALVGAALSVAGIIFQGLLRNPMADPYMIGTSGGAALGASAGVVLSSNFSILGFGTVPTLAFLGAMGTMILVYRLSRVGNRTPVVTLLLVGLSISLILGYTMSFLLIVNDRLQINVRVIYTWLLGGVSLSRWPQVGIIALVVIVGSVLAFAFTRTLNALSLGEEHAAHLGIPVERHKTALIAIGSLLTAAAVTAAGLIGFVGLIVPHFLRLLFGPNHTRLLPLGALGGAVFLVTADLLARIAMPPTELPVGILTAFVGGPTFLFLLRRTKREYRF